MSKLLDASCRLAFAALIHDIGKFAERAKIAISPTTKENNIHIFCPFNAEKGYHSHIHAAYTGIAIDLIEKYLPKINNADTFPFQTNVKDNSIVTAAAKHHKPDTYLQHIICMADRLSSAFERTAYDDYNHTEDNENYQTARLIPLFEELFNNDKSSNFNYRYPLQTLAPETMFPALKKEITKEEATKEYAALWENFVNDIQKVGNSDNWDIWLDAFDTLYSIYTQNIPSSSYNTLADVSLYDHSKSTAALATALWRYHYETGTETINELEDDKQKKFLLVQGDVSGIQDFIFETGKNTRKNSYKILRGRSFMVSLFSECAALKILEELALPATSQIINAAGKFVIVAPNTKETKQKITEIKKYINDWFSQNYYGIVSVGIATIEAAQEDFENKKFADLQQQIYQSLSISKMQKFNLCQDHVSFDSFFDQYQDNKGLCCYDGIMPAKESLPDTPNEYACSRCLDVVSLGEKLTSKNLISISHNKAADSLQTDILGLYIGWKLTDDTIRLWDIKLPAQSNESLFNGYARRYINAYIPRFSEQDVGRDIYQNLDTPVAGKPKTFSHLARENCVCIDKKLQTKSALMCLKGDIDNLGYIFQYGTKQATFATMAGLSRQINNFFAIWLPYLCQSDTQAKNIYTVFAGGDDFYLIGPWLDMVEILPHMREKFDAYVCKNPQITFSVGMCMTRSGDDVVNMSSMTESALEKAKKREENGEVVKNAVACFNRVVSYTDYQDLLNLEAGLEKLHKEYNLTTGYIYGLLTLCEDAKLAAEGKFMHAMWRSKLVYRTARFVENNKDIDEDSKKSTTDLIVKLIGGAIDKYKADYKIVLSIWLYKHREN